MPEKRLIEWAGKQPEWARDALRRHAGSPGFVLSAGDKSAVLERVRHEAGFSVDPAPDHSPITAEHIGVSPAASAADVALLCSLGPVENSGRLASGQILSFAQDGITLIYGDNGSGKSGYCRFAKKICRSLTKDEILGDIFKAGTKPPAKALIRHKPKAGGEIVECEWTDNTPPPDSLRNISVFDSRNARFYVDKQNQIGFLPPVISLLQQHAALRTELGSGFQAERKALENQLRVPLPSGFTPGGKVGKLVDKLISKSVPLPKKSELTELGAWTEDEASELVGLEASLASDPAAVAQRCKRAVAALEPLKIALDTIEANLTTEAADSLREKSDATTAADDAAAVAADEAFADEPLGGVGKDPWRQMYEHAKAYVSSIGKGEDLPSQEGDYCALCQQALDAEASARLVRFNRFVAGAAAKSADDARAALQAALEAVKSVALPDQATLGQSLREYQSMSVARLELGTKLSAHFAAASARQEALIAASADGDFSTVPDLAESLSAEIESEITTLKAEQQTLDAHADDNPTRALAIARRDELKDRKLLSQTIETFYAHLEVLEKYQKLNKCSELVATQSLSQQVTAIRRNLITTGLESRIQQEINGFDLAHIPFRVSDLSKDGESLVGVTIDAPVPAKNDAILSEGEQRALALACFLAEIAADGGNNGIIIDDPVSSLDHRRVRIVAERLVGEAKNGRQVIIFTHNLFFCKEVIGAAAEEGVALAKRLISKTHAEGFGVVTDDDEPWIAKRTAERMKILRVKYEQLAKFVDFNSDDYRNTIKDFYTALRETWERLVEEILLGGVIERFETGVKTQSLKKVSVENDDYTKVFFAMTRASEYSGHDTASSKNIALPKPAKIKEHLDELETYQKILKKRSDQLSEKRRQLEKPSNALVE